MKQWVLCILLYPSFCICQTVEQKYGDRIEILGVAFKDPLVLCQILIAVFFIAVSAPGVDLPPIIIPALSFDPPFV